jgi:hypothetical protein
MPMTLLAATMAHCKAEPHLRQVRWAAFPAGWNQRLCANSRFQRTQTIAQRGVWYHVAGTYDVQNGLFIREPDDFVRRMTSRLRGARFCGNPIRVHEWLGS